MRAWEKQFMQRDETFDGSFRAGEKGVKAVFTPMDGKSEWLVMEDGSAYVRLKTPFCGPVLYPVREPHLYCPPRAVLMDLDGTSVISEEFWIWIVEQTMKEALGNPRFNLKQEDIPFVSGFSVSEHLCYCIGKYGAVKRGPSVELAGAREIYHRITSVELEKIARGEGRTEAFRVRPHLKEFLLALKAAGVKIGLVTSGLYAKAMPEILAAFRQMELGDPFEFYDAVITAGTAYQKGGSGTLGEYCAKPHPWLYAEIAGMGLGLEAKDRDRVAVLEDSGAGVLAGRLAGFAVMGLAGGNLRQAGLECLTEIYTDSLPRILEALLI